MSDESTQSTKTSDLGASTLPNVQPRAATEPSGDEPPPPGVKVMAAVRWALLAVAGLVAALSWWSYASAELGGSVPQVQMAKYHCPMHPQIVSSEPGECPICHMTLEPMAKVSVPDPAFMTAASPSSSGPAVARTGKTIATGAMNETRDAAASELKNVPPAMTPSEPKSAPPGTMPIKLTLDRIQAINVRTAVVGSEYNTPSLRVTAVVLPTDQGNTEVHVRTPGFVERLAVGQTGVVVKPHEPLFWLYSPEILQAQSEIIATEQWESEGRTLGTSTAARQKLELLGMSTGDIARVQQSRQPMRSIPVYAQEGGHVIKKNVVVGSYVTPETTLYEIQDLSRLYVVADVFPRDVAVVHKGMTGRFVPARSDAQALDVQVDLIYPTLNTEARTTRVRMQVNPKRASLRPGEYGVVEFAPSSGTVGKMATVPRDAMIDTGLHTYVFVVEGQGVFSPREVVLGDERGEMLTIASGVATGERVVSGATFLIDSESRLQAAAAEQSAK